VGSPFGLAKIAIGSRQRRLEQLPEISGSGQDDSKGPNAIFRTGVSFFFPAGWSKWAIWDTYKGMVARANQTGGQHGDKGEWGSSLQEGSGERHQ
jgi:hypothetical protein